MWYENRIPDQLSGIQDGGEVATRTGWTRFGRRNHEASDRHGVCLDDERFSPTCRYENVDAQKYSDALSAKHEWPMVKPTFTSFLQRDACFDVPVVIDASNVAGDASTTGCGRFCWNRVEELQQRWKKSIDSNTRFLIVVDESVVPQLSSHCKLMYRAASESKDFRVVRFADPEVLHLAEVHDALVVTRDFYRDQRRSHPWLDGSVTRFIGWQSTDDGLVFGFRDMGVPSDFSKTHAEEAAEFKGRGLSIARPEIRQVLSRAYRCDNLNCWVHKYDPGRFTGVPDFSSIKEPKCPSCGELLVDLGTAPRLVQIKISSLDRTRLERRTLSPGSSFEIGRDSSEDMLRRLLRQDWLAISRRHARIVWNGERLTCADLGSRNGTQRIPWEGKGRGYGESVAVQMSPTVLMPRDEIQIGRVLRVTRSAREFVLETSSDLTNRRESGFPTAGKQSENTLKDSASPSGEIHHSNGWKSGRN